jgi:Zn-dependent peptidase ImmA (M78 family)
MAQLRSLADLYKRPLAVFFLEELPRDFSVMKFFRRLPDSPETDLSHRLAIQLRQALVRREIAIDLIEGAGGETSAFQPKASASESPSDVARRLRGTLGVTVEQQLAWPNEHAAFRGWRQAVEHLGVLTFQVTRVGVAEMRGLAISMQPLPLILLNSGDAVRARSFSLLHELGHLALGDNHLCSAEDEATVGAASHEVWCNDLAGNLLIPAPDLSEILGAAPAQSREVDWAQTRMIADRFKVSQEVVLRRLLAVRRISAAAYRGARENLTASEKHKKKGKGGPAPDVVVVSNLGLPFVRTVLDALHQNRITLSDASDYFDVPVKHLQKIEERAFEGAYSSPAEQ